MSVLVIDSFGLALVRSVDGSLSKVAFGGPQLVQLLYAWQVPFQGIDLIRKMALISNRKFCPFFWRSSYEMQFYPKIKITKEKGRKGKKIKIIIIKNQSKKEEGSRTNLFFFFFFFNFLIFPSFVIFFIWGYIGTFTRAPSENEHNLYGMTNLIQEHDMKNIKI